MVRGTEEAEKTLEKEITSSICQELYTQPKVIGKAQYDKQERALTRRSSVIYAQPLKSKLKLFADSMACSHVENVSSHIKG